MNGDMARDAFEPEQPPDEEFIPETTDDLIEEGRREALSDVRETLMEHIPSLSDEDEQAIFGGMAAISMGVENADVADLALRTCRCGVKIDGMYALIDHQLEVLGLAPAHLAG